SEAVYKDGTWFRPQKEAAAVGLRSQLCVATARAHTPCCPAPWRSLRLAWPSCFSPRHSVPRPPLPFLVLTPRPPAASSISPGRFLGNLWSTIMRPAASAPSPVSFSKPKEAGGSVPTRGRPGSRSTSATWS
ncbi:unnamed protein product, partial [Gulo gulo]